jgi:predicted RNA binding protein YcfA (HicA-like mRNA interferase family)
MAVIRIRYQGKIHSRTVTRNYRGWYIMTSKGSEYWFRKDENGWNLINGTSLPENFMTQIAEQLDLLEGH